MTLKEYAFGFDYEMDSVVGDIKVRGLVMKTIRIIIGKKKVTKCEILCRLKNGIKMVKCYHQEVTETAILRHIEYMVNHALREANYDFRVAIYEFI